MRITAGAMRGRVITVPNVPGLRPTPSKVRQALFNILGSVDGFRILDLFAGSGIMALEALSRGAASATSIEQDRVKPVWPDGWVCRQSRRYGDTCLHFLLRQRIE